MERAELRPPKNSYAIPESPLTRSRKMTPETDPIMSEEDLAFCVKRFRTDSRVLVMLAVSHAKVNTPAQIKNYYEDLEPSSAGTFTRSGIAKILNELTDHGALERIEKIEGSNFSVPDYTDTFVSQAGHLAELSVKYPVRLSQLFGRAESPDNYSSALHSEGLHTQDRIRVLRKLNEMRRTAGDKHRPISGIQHKIAGELFLHPLSVGAHLKSLSDAGVISYHSTNGKNGSYQEYALAKDIPDYKGQEIAVKNTVSDWVREYVQVEFYKNLSTDDAFSYVLQHMNDSEGMDDLQMDRLKKDVTQAMYNLRRRGVIQPVSAFGNEGLSYVEFNLGRGNAALLRDSVLTLFTMQREEAHIEQEGIAKGRKILTDREAVRKLLEKVRADSKKIQPYSEEKTNT